MQLKCKKKNCALYGECAVTDGTCQMVPAGDFSLDNAPQSGRQVEVDSDQIKTLIKNIQCYTMWEIANSNQ